MLETIAHGPIVELRMNRPPANALSAEMIAALEAGVSEATTGEVRAVVISGQPGMFSAGLDVPSLLQLGRDGIHRAWSDFFSLLATITRSPVPVVAALTGHAPAGGAVISLFCDYRIMARGEFIIGLNETEVGVTLPPVLFRALARQVGASHAERLAVAGMLVSGDEAFRIGLVDELAAIDDVVPSALVRCQRMLAMPPATMSATRRIAREDLVGLFDLLTEAALESVVDNWFTDETQAALHALVARLAAKSQQG